MRRAEPVARARGRPPEPGRAPKKVEIKENPGRPGNRALYHGSARRRNRPGDFLLLTSRGRHGNCTRLLRSAFTFLSRHADMRAYSRENSDVAKPEWGVKRTCQSC